MRALLLSVIISSTMAVPATAQSMSRDESGGMTFNETVSSFYSMPTAHRRADVLVRFRQVCESTSRGDQKRCARGLAILKAGYAQLQSRRAAEDTVID